MAFPKHRVTMLVIFISIALDGFSQMQMIGKHWIGFGVSGGFLQQESTISYQYAPFFIKGGAEKKVGNQIFVGLEAGTSSLKSNLVSSTSMFGSSFKMFADGMHYSFLVSNIISHPLVNINKPYQYRYIGLKFTVQKFQNVNAYEYDTYNENDDLDSDEPDIIITNENCKSFDITLRYGRNLILNSSNFVRFEFYSGFRFCKFTGIKNSDYYNGVDWVHNRYPFSRSINPIIVGVGLNYQINVGSRNYRKS